MPRQVPLHGDASGWRLDLEALHGAVSHSTCVLFLMNPAVPSGWVANEEEWATVTGICREREITLLYWMVMEAMVFGGRPVVVPSGLEGMRDLTVTAGAVSLEQRMIGWRVGWTVARAELAPSLALVHIYNGVVSSGFGFDEKVAATPMTAWGETVVPRYVRLGQQRAGRAACAARRATARGTP